MFDVTDKRYRLLMDILLYAISKKESITYGRVHEIALEENGALGKEMHYHRNIPELLGALNRKIEASHKDAPTTSAIVINKQTKLPGDGIEKFRGFRGWLKLDKEQKRKRVARIQEQVFLYKSWHGIYATLFNNEEPRVIKRDGKIPQGSRAGGGEGKQHKKLKEYVAKNPEKLGLTKVEDVEMEYPLPSGDQVDVALFQKNRTILVEVKAHISPDDDLKRGIYQCVKYRAVYCAKCLKKIDVTEASDFVNAMLVTERDLPPELAELARTLKIKHKTIKLRA